MDKEDKQCCIIIISAILIFSFFILNIYQCEILSGKDVAIEGTVTNAVFSDKYMTITFNNNKTYNIRYETYEDTTTDFTVHSKMYIKLHYSSWWLWPNADEVWGIQTIVKVPDNT